MDEDTSIRVRALHAALDSIDYYALLGVDRRCGRDGLREAYYRFAEEFHPDNYRDEPAELRTTIYAVYKRAAEAYRVLGDMRLRQRYDKGLPKGQNRLAAEEVSARATLASTEPQFATLTARNLWRQAIEAASAGDLKRARLSLMLVQSHERDNPNVRAMLEDVERKLKESGGR